MNAQFLARCLDCGRIDKYSLITPACSGCGSFWREAVYDYKKIANDWQIGLPVTEFNLWRYHDLLPIYEPFSAIQMGEGGTPLIHAKNLGSMLGNSNIFIKDERQNPTGSFKDRQAAVSMTAYVEANIQEVVCCSTGNVAISYSAYAARAGIRLWAYLTSLVPSEKMREIALFGTRVMKVTGTYDSAKVLAQEFAEQRSIYYDLGSRSIACVESMKTLAFEICEQIALRRKNLLPSSPSKAMMWCAPDWYIQSVSGGLGPLGVLKGFVELQEMSLITRIPTMGLVQVDGCAPMAHAWDLESDVAEPVQSPRTLISTLATGDPGRTYTELFHRIKRAGGGVINRVSDEEAFKAMHLLAEIEGISVEPAAAVAFAGLNKLIRAGQIRSHETVVINCTGHTMPVESHILGDISTREVKISRKLESRDQEEGLLAALDNINSDRFQHVLIVDDEPQVRQLVIRILCSGGNFIIKEAANGREALEKVKTETPDLIILDLMMPDVDGFSVINALQSQKETASIPIIVITAKELTISEKHALKGRIHRLMQKGDFLNAKLLEDI